MFLNKTALLRVERRVFIHIVVNGFDTLPQTFVEHNCRVMVGQSRCQTSLNVLQRGVAGGMFHIAQSQLSTRQEATAAVKSLHGVLKVGIER